MLFPILLIVLIGGVQFTQIIMASQTVAAAARVGVREASVVGATEASVENVVDRVVAGWRFANDPSLAVMVEAAKPDGTAIPFASASTGDLVAVSVSVDSTAAVSDMLASFGITFAGSQLQAKLVARKE